MLSCPRCPIVKSEYVLDTVVISGEDVCCRLYSELLITSAISFPLWSSVYECHNVVCAFTPPVRTECGMFVMCCMSVPAVL